MLIKFNNIFYLVKIAILSRNSYQNNGIRNSFLSYF